MMDQFGLAFFVVTMVWLLAEITFTTIRRAGEGASLRQDRGSLRWINVAIYTSIPFAFWISTQKTGRFPADLQWIRWTGIAMIIGGSAIKWYAVHQLRSRFTVDVAIIKDHRLVCNGLYRRIRHPSYLGALTAFAGLGIALGNLLSIPALLVPITLAFLFRIHVEEAVLNQAFPDEYPAYRRSSWALIPFVY